ncbi:hypothetical protein AvCA_22790 [Azotobacter vinelandii CA]|uniref:Uncharacterized protein n=2 Tax=Azotobacter vinelandii TaxID=354 RepID=C1DGF9_AZOVD|nr:hypothetical protein Avin_22790 [Azotobacter vinelandii DJ]AGK14995.1 hypothetical protein AvCA_22790 [Azotobacter vinelandii CA]AGK20532.1 hypothetical protein AvCA6_22790 [Azotobacter vinelandii CA6]
MHVRSTAGPALRPAGIHPSVPEVVDGACEQDRSKR